MYSVASGEVVYRLSYSEHHKQSSNKRSELLIKSICLNPVNKYQLLTFHLNGKVCLWDYDDGLLLKVNKRIYHEISFRKIKLKTIQTKF